MDDDLYPIPGDFSDLCDASFDTLLNLELWPSEDLPIQPNTKRQEPCATVSGLHQTIFAHNRSGSAPSDHHFLDSNQAPPERTSSCIDGNNRFTTDIPSGERVSTFLDPTLATATPRCIDCRHAQYLNEEVGLYLLL